MEVICGGWIRGFDTGPLGNILYLSFKLYLAFNQYYYYYSIFCGLKFFLKMGVHQSQHESGTCVYVRIDIISIRILFL